MALIGANELKRKGLIEVEGQPYTVIDFTVASPTARGAATMVRTRLRHLLTGAVQERSFKATEKFPEPDVELSPATFMYRDADGFHFMNDATYEHFTLPERDLREEQNYLVENTPVQVLYYNGAPASVRLPQFVELTVASVELGTRGDTAAGGATKQATLETGLQVRVPLFIKEGERVRVSTETGEVAGRA